MNCRHGYFTYYTITFEIHAFRAFSPNQNQSNILALRMSFGSNPLFFKSVHKIMKHVLEWSNYFDVISLAPVANITANFTVTYVYLWHLIVTCLFHFFSDYTVFEESTKWKEKISEEVALQYKYENNRLLNVLQRRELEWHVIPVVNNRPIWVACFYMTLELVS